MSTTYSITTKHQVTIPKKMRESIKLGRGDRVYFESRGDEIIIKKTTSLQEVSSMLQADLKRRGWNKTVTQEDMDQAHGSFIKQGDTW